MVAIFRGAIRSLLISGTYDYKDMYNETTGVETSDKTINSYGAKISFQNIELFL